MEVTLTRTEIAISSKDQAVCSTSLSSTLGRKASTHDDGNMLDTMRMLARSTKLELLRCWAEWRVRQLHATSSVPATQPPAFVIGCGRSGTTILGTVLSKHPDLKYFFEPWHLWATVDPLNDVSNLFFRVAGRLLRDGDEVTPEARLRFERLFLEAGERTGKLVVEKTPHNAMRIGYLEALAPLARFVHIIRDGGEVCQSIARMAAKRSYRILGRPNYNAWWGVNDARWTALARDGKAAGYHPHDVDAISDVYGRAAYEWLVSLGEIDRWRQRLGDRLCEITYNQLVESPSATLVKLARFLDISLDHSWIAYASRLVRNQRNGRPAPLVLPLEMAHAVNYYQHRFGFDSTAIAGQPAMGPWRQAA